MGRISQTANTMREMGNTHLSHRDTVALAASATSALIRLRSLARGAQLTGVWRLQAELQANRLESVAEKLLPCTD